LVLSFIGRFVSDILLRNYIADISVNAANAMGRVTDDEEPIAMLTMTFGNAKNMKNIDGQGGREHTYAQLMVAADRRQGGEDSFACLHNRLIVHIPGCGS
jgi:hypothetical protein